MDMMGASLGRGVGDRSGGRSPGLVSGDRRAWSGRAPSRSSTAGSFVWAVSTSDKYHHLAWLLLLLRDEIVDRLQVKLVIHCQQVHIQHEQIPLPVHYLLAR